LLKKDSIIPFSKELLIYNIYLLCVTMEEIQQIILDKNDLLKKLSVNDKILFF